MLKKIHSELVAIRKELQAINESLESRNKEITIDSKEVSNLVRKAIHGKAPADGGLSGNSAQE